MPDSININKNKKGRPFKYNNPQQLQDTINKYFYDQDNRMIPVIQKMGNTVNTIYVNKPAPYTMSGLARALGVDLDTLRNYRDNDLFGAIIRDAKQKCMEYAETQLFEGNDRGAAFNLKNNYKESWSDKQEIDINGNVLQASVDLGALDTVDLHKMLQMMLDDPSNATNILTQPDPKEDD